MTPEHPAASLEAFSQAAPQQYTSYDYTTNARMHLYNMSQSVVRMAYTGELLAIMGMRNCLHPD